MMVVFGQGLLSVSFALQPSPNDCFVVKKKEEKKVCVFVCVCGGGGGGKRCHLVEFQVLLLYVENDS